MHVYIRYSGNHVWLPQHVVKQAKKALSSPVFSKTIFFGPLKTNVRTKVGLIYLFTRRERGEEGGRIPLGLVKREEEEEEALFPRLALPYPPIPSRPRRPLRRRRRRRRKRRRKWKGDPLIPKKLHYASCLACHVYAHTHMGAEAAAEDERVIQGRVSPKKKTWLFSISACPFSCIPFKRIGPDAQNTNSNYGGGEKERAKIKNGFMNPHV